MLSYYTIFVEYFISLIKRCLQGSLSDHRRGVLQAVRDKQTSLPTLQLTIPILSSPSCTRHNQSTSWNRITKDFTHVLI